MQARRAERAARSDGTMHGMDAVLAGGGHVGRLIGETDWSKTPLGPLERWKPSLRSAVSICMASRFPIVMYWGPELTVIYNDAYSEILGAKHPWALGKPCSVCWSEIWDTIGPMLNEVVSTGVATWSDDLELLLERNGSPEECYFSFSFSPVRVEDGSVGGVFTAVVETTSRTLSDRRLRVLSQLGDRSVGADTAQEAGSRCIEAMASTRAVPFALLYMCEEQDYARLVAATGLDPTCSAYQSTLHLNDGKERWRASEVFHTGKPVQVELDPSEVRPDGGWAHEVAPATAIVSPIAGREPGRIYGVLVTATNPLRPLDADYLAFFDLVAKQVSGAVVQAQGYEIERRRAETLTELDRVKTEFFSNVSHEFRTPLTLMLGPLESLLEQAEPGSQQEFELDMARRNALRLLKLVNTLLDFAGIQAARRDVAFEQVDLAAFTAELAALFRAAAERAGLQLVVDCEALEQPVYVDRAMWEKIVLNLLSNALKFTLEGEIRIGLRDVDGAAVLTVSDTGTGIPEADLPRIFDRFFRARSSRSRTHEGAGIGLALVKELVEIMGGEIEVSSRPGHGTVFHVTMPYRPQSAEGHDLLAETSPVLSGPAQRAYVTEAMGWNAGVAAPDAPAETAPGEGRILLVDDNADMRAYLQQVLRDRWEVEPAADGIEALAAIRRRRPDLVLTDVMMPNMDGFELLNAIRRDPELRDLPVIVVSARAGEDSLDGLTNGADDYLVKPFTVQELRARVSANLGLVRMRAELARSRADLALADERASFLNMAAHELRTPLTVIGGYVDLILGGVLDRRSVEAQHALEKVAYKTKEAVRLVEQMLTAARMESGALVINASPTDLRELAANAVDRAQPLAGLEAMQLVCVVPEAPVPGMVDPALAGLILDNLLSNAIFHGAGPIRVEVEASPPRVRVLDSGPGVGEEVRGRIFEPFFQVEGKLHARGGAGLGLAVSRRLAELHGGALVLEETATGASFVLSLPPAGGQPELKELVAQVAQVAQEGTNGVSRRVAR